MKQKFLKKLGYSNKKHFKIKHNFPVILKTKFKINKKIYIQKEKLQ